MKELIDQLYKERNLDSNALCQLIALADDSQQELYLFEKARQKKEEVYQDKIYIRGLIELSNYCKNNCLYCGIRAVNTSIERYRLSKEQILDCTRYGHELGFRTFVLQGGEDPAYSDEEICDIVRQIKEEHLNSSGSVILPI